MARNKGILKKLDFILVICFLVFPKNNFGFKTLSQAEKYAESVQEFPLPDTDDLMHPTYKKFHGSNTGKFIKGMLPDWANNILSKYIFPKKIWSPDDFISSLDEIIFRRELEGLKPNYIVKITASPENKFYIFGPILGSFHSIVRSLKELKRLKVLDDSLNIIDNNYKIIFNGNVIDNSPYILQTLTLIINLLNKNPQNVFYNLGSEEYEDAWLNSSLNEGIRSIKSSANPEFKKVAYSISRFFKTLPLGIFINNTQEENSFIRISYFGRNMEKLEEENFPDLTSIKTIPGEYKIIRYLNKEKILGKVKIISLIKADERINKVSASSGLYIMESERGATSWAIISSPNLRYKKLYQFNYDTFVILSVKNPITESTLTLVHQDVRVTKGFDAHHIFNIISGQELKASKQEALKKKRPIVLGSTLALTKSIATMGSDVKAGLSLKEKLINQSGGINGRGIEIIFADDAYTPDIALKNVKKFISDYFTNIIITPVGTPTLEACLGLIKKHEILALFPVTGASIFRDKNLKNIINYRPSYTQEVKTLIKYVAENTSSKRFAFFYQNDAYGLGPLEAAKITLSRMGLTDWVDIPYTRNEFNIEAAVAKIKETKPDAIALFSTGVATSELIRQLGSENLANKTMFTISFAADKAFKAFARSKGVNIIFAHAVPNPEESDLPIVKEYREEIKKTGSSTSTFSLEGYIALSIFAEAIKAIKGEINSENIIAVLENIKDLDLGGIKLNFDPETRELSQSVWLDTGVAQWLKFEKSEVEPKAELIQTTTRLDLKTTSTEIIPKIIQPTKVLGKDLLSTSTIDIKLTSTVKIIPPELILPG